MTDRDCLVVQQTTSELDTGQDGSRSACTPHPPLSHPPTAFSPAGQIPNPDPCRKDHLPRRAWPRWPSESESS